MPSKPKSHEQVIAAILGVVVIAMFFSVLPQIPFLSNIIHGTKMEAPPPPPPPQLPPMPPALPTGSEDGMTETLSVRHVYEDGTHSISGEVTTPTPCHTVRADALVAESYPEQVMIDIAIEAPEGDVMCAQVLDTQEFSVEFSASEEATVRARINGAEVALEVL